MKAYAIADTFRGAFAADGAFAGKAILNEQSAPDKVTPAVIFACTTKGLNGSGSALTYTLTAWVESPSEKRLPTDPDPATSHATLVELVRAKLLGTGRVALKVTVNNAGAFDFRGWSAAESDPGMEGHAFRTPVAISGTLLVL